MAYAPYNTQRDDEIVAAYLGGASSTTIAKQKGMNPNTVAAVLHRRGVRLTKAEFRRRVVDQLVRNRADPAVEARRISRMAVSKRIWPDCPPDRRAEYMRLRESKGYTAAEARALIEADMRKGAP